MLQRISPDLPLVLGSGSPRRRELLAAQGIPLLVRAPSVDESARSGEEPGAYLARIVADKLAATQRLAGQEPGAAVLVADTIVLEGGSILGKPASDEEAASMIRRLAGRVHEVWTCFAVGAPASGAAPAALEVTRTRVTFRPLDERRIQAYVATGEGRDKAGAYAVQGIGAALVARIEGSYTNVVGLPVCEVMQTLESLGVFVA